MCSQSKTKRKALRKDEGKESTPLTYWWLPGPQSRQARPWAGGRGEEVVGRAAPIFNAANAISRCILHSFTQQLKKDTNIIVIILGKLVWEKNIVMKKSCQKQQDASVPTRC